MVHFDGLYKRVKNMGELFYKFTVLTLAVLLNGSIIILEFYTIGGYFWNTKKSVWHTQFQVSPISFYLYILNRPTEFQAQYSLKETVWARGLFLWPFNSDHKVDLSLGKIAYENVV